MITLTIVTLVALSYRLRKYVKEKKKRKQEKKLAMLAEQQGVTLDGENEAPVCEIGEQQQQAAAAPAEGPETEAECVAKRESGARVAAEPAAGETKSEKKARKKAEKEAKKAEKKRKAKSKKEAKKAKKNSAGGAAPGKANSNSELILRNKKLKENFMNEPAGPLKLDREFRKPIHQTLEISRRASLELKDFELKRA